MRTPLTAYLLHYTTEGPIPDTLEVPIRGRVQLSDLELGDEAGE